MLWKLILTILSVYYLAVLWRYYRSEWDGIFGSSETEEDATDGEETRKMPGTPCTIIGKSTYRLETIRKAETTPENKAVPDDDADYSDIEIDEEEEAEDEYVPTPEELEEEEELDAYYPEGNPDFATGYTFEDLQKVHLVLTTDKPDEQARQEALAVLPAVMGSDIYEAMLNEFEGARQRVARLMNK